jgi:hypothetical protein
MAEQLFATDVRFFVETSAGSATPSGDVVIPPLNQAIVARISNYVEEKVTPFRHKLGRESVLEWFNLTFEFHVGGDFLAFLIEPHLRGGTALDFRSPEPTFALEMQSEDGDKIVFAGLALRELQVSMVGRGVANAFVNLNGLSRASLGSLTASTAEIGSEPISGEKTIVAVNTGPLDPFPWASNKIDARSADLYFRREVTPSQFNHWGTPERHDVGPWRIFGEVTTPADAFTETATGTFVDGSCVFFLGEIGSNLQLAFDDSVRWLSQNDPIKADDFRDYRIMFEAEANADGVILELTNNLP